MTRLVLLALGLFAASCATWPEPPPELLEAIRVQAGREPRSFRGRATLSIDSRHLRGDFEALVAARAGPPTLVRLQLFPDLGGKILDVTASPARIRGAFERSEAVVDADPAAAPRHPIVFFGLTLLEIAAPLTPDRVRGARPDPETGLWEVRLAPVAGDYDLRAWIDRSGRVVRRRYRFRHVTWTETVDEVPRVEAKSFSLAVRDAAIERGVEVPDRLFEAVAP